jgi:gliding motility-associated-like protein
MNQRYIIKSLQIILLAVCLFQAAHVQAVPPAQVLTVQPLAQAQQGMPNSDVVVTFDAPVAATAVNTTNFIVEGAQSGRVVGAFTGGGSSTITFNPDRDFHAGEVVTVTLTAGLGVLTSGYTWQFTVMSAPVAPIFTTVLPLATDATTAYDVYPIDMDRDGDVDMVSAAVGNVISWYENVGTSALVNHRITPLGAGAPTSLRATDLDNDGDIDILFASFDDNAIIWLENNGSQVFTPRTLASGDMPSFLYTADMDGDGLVDVLAASENQHSITLYKNDGTSNFTVIAVATGVRGANALHVADVDDDGDLDILSSSFDTGTLSDGKIAWYENQQATGFVPATISTAVLAASYVFAADMDRDGDMDVVSASDQTGELFWHENDGSQTFTIRTIATMGGDASGRGLHVADMDGDGDMDVLSANARTKDVLWYENNGAQAFASRVVANGAADVMMTIHAADVDGDGDLEVMTASDNDNTVAWFLNSATPVVNHAPTFTKGGDIVVDEDAPLQRVAAWATNISAGAGESGQVLHFVVGNDNNALFSAQPAIDATGALTFQPAANAWGTATVTVVLHDNGGTIFRGTDQSAPATFVITVNPVNDAPLIDAVADVVLPIGSVPVTITLTGIHPGPNEDGQQLTITASSGNPVLLGNPAVTLHADGTASLVLAPAPGASGTITVTVVLRDDGGTARGGDNETVITFAVILTDEGIFQAVFIPTLFSPNNDGSNDVFRVRTNDVADIRFSVYTADGQEVFRTTDISQATEQGWDGRYHGREMPTGTYTWTLQGHFTNGDPLTSGKHGYGQVMLLR